MFSWLVLFALFLYIYQPLAAIWEISQFSLTPIYVTCLVIIWLLSWLFDTNKKRLFENIITSALLMYSFVFIVSTLFSPYLNNAFGSWYFRMWMGHLLLFVIFMMSTKTDRDLKIVLTGLLVVYFMYMAHAYWNFLNGHSHFSMGVERLYGTGDRDPNFFAACIVSSLVLLLPTITLCKKYWHYLFVLGYLFLALRVVVLTGSRGGMIMLVALAILPILFSRHRFKILPIVLLALSLGWFFMPEQYQNRFRSIWNPTFGIQGGESSRQGRIKGFYNGLEIWQKYPLFGCGPGASRWAGSWDHETHNLPGQLAGELGTFGIITFLILLTCFGINHYNIWKNYKYLQEKKFDDEGLYYWRVSIAVMYGVFLLLFQGISLHNGYEYHWMWFAAFQALAAIFIQEKVTAAKQGKLLPSLPVKR